MLFDEEYKKRVQGNANSNMFARDSYSSQLFPKPKTGGYKPYESTNAFNPDLDTSDGLYQMASKAGLQAEADVAVNKAGGARPEFFSGGIVSDVFDLLNISSYGVVGMFKGKSFAEGVRDRDSFADDDALGKYGITGMIAGLALDIFTDPLTYVAPLKIIAKVPGVTRVADKVGTKMMGELTQIRLGDKTASFRTGGWTPLTLLANKFAYGFSMDRKALEGVQEIIDRKHTMMSEFSRTIDTFRSMGEDATKEVLTWKTTTLANGNKRVDLARRDKAEVMQILNRNGKITQEQKDSVVKAYDSIEANADELVDLGVLTKETRDRYIDDYLIQMYDNVAASKAKKPGFSKGGIGITYRERKNLTLEQKKELGIIEDPGVVLSATYIKQVDDLTKARLNKHLADNVAMTYDELLGQVSKEEIEKNFHRVEDSARYRLDAQNVTLRKELKTLKKSTKQFLKERKVFYKDRADVVSEISQIEKRLDDLYGMSTDNLSEAISGLRKVVKEGGLKVGAPKKVPTTQGQKLLANSIKSFLNAGKKADRLARETKTTEDLFEEFMLTREGIALSRAFDNPEVMYQWKSPEEFFSAIRHPDRAIIQQEPSSVVDDITDAVGDKSIERAEKQAREIGALKFRKEVLSEDLLKQLDELATKMEDDYSDLIFQKEDILQSIQYNKMGQLAGKYIPKEMYEIVKGVHEPGKEFGEAAVLWFKHMKVIWNPASYPRNLMGAMVANWWKLGIGPWRVDTYLDAYKELKNRGKVFQEMEQLGFHPTTGQLHELVTNYLSDKEVVESLSKQWGVGKSETLKKLKNFDRWAMNAYGHVDNIAKIAAYKHGLKKGMSKEDALAAAYTATFNYSHVTPFVHQMRRAAWGVPFITFSLKAVPLVGSTLYNNPGRISFFGKARNALWQSAGIEADQEAEAQPEWMRDDAFMMRLPWKDSEGRSMYFDMTYIIPFGDIVSGGYMKSLNPTEDNFGSFNPVLNLLKELSTNKTFGGYKIFNESDDRDTIIADIVLHTGKLALPPMGVEFMSKGYDDKGNRVHGTYNPFAGTEDRGPNERTYYQEMFRAVGFGVQPFDLESKERSMEYSRKTELSKMLTEKGILQEFNTLYQPKESQLGKNLFEEAPKQLNEK